VSKEDPFKQKVLGQSDAQKEDQVFGHRNERLSTLLFNPYPANVENIMSSQ
jgi:hypothetical protein